MLDINSSIQNLNLSCNELGKGGIFNIAISLSYKNNSLKMLDLSIFHLATDIIIIIGTNNLQIETALIFECLVKNKSLLHVNLSNNNAKCRNPTDLAEIVKNNHTLQYLDLCIFFALYCT